MLLDELHLVLNLVVTALEAEDSGLSSSHHLQQAYTALNYALATSSSELDSETSYLVNEVCQSLMSTLRSRLQLADAEPSEFSTRIGLDKERFQSLLQQRTGFREREGHQESDYELAIPDQLLVFPQERKTQHQEDMFVVCQHPDYNSFDNIGDQLNSNTCPMDTGSALAAQSVDVLDQFQHRVSGSLDDVAGLESVKQEIRQAVIWPLKMPHLFRGYRTPPKSFLLVGPPGTGKTMLVEKIAAECSMTLLVITPSAVLSKWSGEAEKTVRLVFAAARTMQPSIVFIDELDALASQRTSQDDPTVRRLLTELLIQMSAAVGQEALYVFACTNRIQDCDPAMLRRFERRTMIPLPDEGCRMAFILKALSSPEMENNLSDENLHTMVKLTEGYSCSDLKSVCKEAAMAPVRELLTSYSDHCGVMKIEVPSGSYRKERTDRGKDSETPTFASNQPAIQAETLRSLSLQDFQDAISVIKPATADQANMSLN